MTETVIVNYWLIPSFPALGSTGAILNQQRLVGVSVFLNIRISNFMSLNTPVLFLKTHLQLHWSYLNGSYLFDLGLFITDHRQHTNMALNHTCLSQDYSF